MTVSFFQSNRLTEAGFPIHGFTKRQGGVSVAPYDSLNLAHHVGDEPAAVVENFARLRQSIGTDHPLVCAKQVHGKTVIDVSDIPMPSDTWRQPPTMEADGLLTNNPSMLIGVQTADCVPILLADPVTRWIGVLHAGWRGTAKGIVRDGVRALLHRGVATNQLIAVIGPCICESCYEVGLDVARHFPESTRPIRGKEDHVLLDLGNAVEVSLLIVGVRGENIERIQSCTKCDADSLFSYRRDGASTGRSLGFLSSSMPSR